MGLHSTTKQAEILTSASLAGIGTASPEYSISQANSVAVARRFVHREHEALASLPALYRLTRVAQRGSVLLEGPADEEVRQSFYPQASHDEDGGPSTQLRMERFAAAAGALAGAAAENAVRDAEITADQVTHLITITCTGFYAPGFDIELIEGLGLSPEVERLQIGFMGCHAIINGLRAARAIADGDRRACVLVVAVELCSLHYQYGWDTDRVVANALFADGGGAFVVRSQGAETNGKPRPRVLATGSRLLPDTKQMMTWKVGNHGYQMTLAAAVPGLIEQRLADYLIPWLQRQGLAFDNIGGWATHPGGPRVLAAVEKALGLPRDAHRVSRQILAQHGNMSSATLAFIVAAMRDAATPLPWLMLGFGPGLEIEVALLG
jgi:predicted naringenin-chalcone synthase